MPLLDRTGWKADAYRRDEPGADAVIVPLDLLTATLAGKLPGQRVGIDLSNDTDPDALTPVLGKVDLIAVAFPKFGDGRGFSLARALRAMGFGGTLRASGPLIPDQFAFALQCGFDEVELSDEQAARQPVEQWLHALEIVDVSYQDGVDGTPSIFRRRAAAR